jgi:superfamily II DNA/RNA helicase
LQRSADAKRSDDPTRIRFILASATLTKAVSCQLAGPILAADSFVFLVDADIGKVDRIRSIADLQAISNQPAEELSLSQTTDNEDLTKKSRLGLVKDDIVEAPAQLAQYFMIVTCKWRLAALASFLRLHQQQKVIVFFSTCDAVDFHSLLFRESSWPLELDPSLDNIDDLSGMKKRFRRTNIAPLSTKFQGMFGEECQMFRLHGNMPQRLRHDVFEAFAESTSGILLCTDVAARGLDLPQVDWILQYDPPVETSDYVHRIGRTARKGHHGSALIFLLPAEASYIHLLQSHSLQPQALSLLSLFTETSRLIPGALKFKNIDEMTAVILQRRLDRVVDSNANLIGAAQQAFRSFTRAYATHSADTKSIFQVQSLHLGHVAKSFALRERPTALRVEENDIIGRIMNGEFVAAATTTASSTTGLTRKEKKRKRDEKYSLSARKKMSQGNFAAGGTKSKQDKSKQQKIRRTSAKAAKLAPSGRFRKSGGYFRKKLRAQSSAEFSQ